MGTLSSPMAARHPYPDSHSDLVVRRTPLSWSESGICDEPARGRYGFATVSLALSFAHPAVLGPAMTAASMQGTNLIDLRQWSHCNDDAARSCRDSTRDPRSMISERSASRIAG
jgi:hypothetical protein